MFALSNLRDGEPPAYRAIADASEATAEEVVVEEVPPGWVWDEATGELREPTPEEALEPKKAQKIAEMHAAALDELSPLFTNGAGENELAFILAAHVRRILGNQADPRLAVVEEVGSKALAKRDEVEAAMTEAEVEAIEWEEPA